MSEAAEQDEPNEGESSTPGSEMASEPEAEVESSGPVDQLGIPMSREPTLDDVRSDGQKHRALAFGCSLAVVVMVAAFFMIRVLLLG